MEPLNISSYRPEIDVSSPDFDPVPVGDLNHDALLISVFDVLILVRAVYIQAHLFHKSGRHDKEDQHDKHHVQHGCQINFVFRFLLETFNSMQLGSLQGWQSGARIKQAAWGGN